MFKRIKGQSTLEYALIIAVVVGALLAMQIYMKRGMEGRMRKAADDIGQQFEAEKTYVEHTTVRSGKSVEHVNKGVTTIDTGGGAGGKAEETRFKGTETVGALK